MNMSAKCVQGFKVLPLRFSRHSTSYHELFIKEHSVRTFDESKPPGKTLFMVNVPPYATEDSLKTIFIKAGKIKAVILPKVLSEAADETKHGFKVGYVVFEKHDSLVKALKLNNLESLSSKEQPILTGMSKWIHDYNSTIYDHIKLSEEVKQNLTNYDKKEDEKLNAKVDDEGWTVVTKRGRNPGISRKESVENKLINKNKLRSRKKELKNFYTFQIKEQKMNNIITLRKNFEESKEKVSAMKKLRNFKPF